MPNAQYQIINMLETKVHSELLTFLRQTEQPKWIHHLTMARLVARGLRLGHSTLIQTCTERQQYYLSYLAPALLTSDSVILVTPLSLQKKLLNQEIPELQKWLNTNKLITTNINFDLKNHPPVLILITPEIWLKNRLESYDNFLDNIPTIIDIAEKLEDYVREYFTITILPQDWYNWQQEFPEYQTLIRDVLIKLTVAIFAHPENPYKSYPLDLKEKEIIIKLCQELSLNNKVNKKLNFLNSFCQKQPKNKPNLIYAYREREKGQFQLYCYPVEIASKIKHIWSKQPILLIGSYLENDKNAPIYCKTLGINTENITFLKFTIDPQNKLLKLYLPEVGLPLPNTPEFKKELIREIMALIGVTSQNNQPIIILVNDVPLKGQLAVNLATQFGSRIVVEPENLLNLSNNNIVICDWQYWQKYQHQIPSPQLIIMATLPIPSLENPLVAAKVSYYKSQGQDWFRDYLLPTAIKEMQTALISIRNTEGIVALLDNRVNFRSYGTNILTTLEPFAKINYLDLSCFY